ncbi:MAG: zinc-dependent metalloprotease [Aequorivita sp.]|nr:zinc-dependent metalloprotease [Aequorivita sp.]
MCDKAHAQIHCEIDTLASANKEALYAPYKSLDYSSYSFCVKLYVNVIRKSDGTGGQSVSDVYQALSYLDTSYNPHNIYFKWSHQINYIDDTYKYNNPSGAIFNVNNHTDGIDIYLYDDFIPLLGFTGGGQANEQKTALFVTGYFVDNNSVALPLVKSHVLSHEVGHILFLWHTHHGTGENTTDPSECPELVNGSNSNICGDYITDTPADPNMHYNVDLATCTWLGSGMDANGDSYKPDEHNIMSYTQPKCMKYFTSKQSTRMKNAMANIARLQLVSNYTTYGYPCATPGLNYYPNAADTELNLDLREKPENIYEYQLYNYYGVLVLSGESTNILKTLDTSTLDEGLYFLHFYENGELIVKQLVIEH